MEIEQEFVYDVYDSIAAHFSDTRFCTWDFVKQFLAKQLPTGRGIEIGCGNGKNLHIRDDLDLIGVDTCEEFIEICNKKTLRVYRQNCCALRFKENSFDYAFAIAVFHHLATDVRRVKAMSEMIRILKPGGKGICSMWSFEQIERKNNMKMREFVLGDNYVPWMRKGDDKVFTRYYYIFNETMIKQWIQQFEPLICIERVFNERGNWVIEFTKK
tara:strand:- start:10920 stop:11561 length:642 start_codon:yes stop_codon:yes gene_type:complete